MSTAATTRAVPTSSPPAANLSRPGQVRAIQHPAYRWPSPPHGATLPPNPPDGGWLAGVSLDLRRRCSRPKWPGRMWSGRLFSRPSALCRVLRPGSRGRLGAAGGARLRRRAGPGSGALAGLPRRGAHGLRARGSQPLSGQRDIPPGSQRGARTHSPPASRRSLCEPPRESGARTSPTRIAEHEQTRSVTGGVIRVIVGFSDRVLKVVQGESCTCLKKK